MIIGGTGGGACAGCGQYGANCRCLAAAEAFAKRIKDVFDLQQERGDHRPVGAGGEFVWDGTDERVGT